jgi:hypothetical protein
MPELPSAMPSFEPSDTVEVRAAFIDSFIRAFQDAFGGLLASDILKAIIFTFLDTFGGPSASVIYAIVCTFLDTFGGLSASV